MSADHDPCHERDKKGLFRLAGLVVVVLGCMVVGPFVAGHLPEKSDVLLGGIATGLILFLRDIVAAVRAGWEEVTRSKTNEQLAKGAPPKAPVPEDAADAANSVANAAAGRAAEIEEDQK